MTPHRSLTLRPLVAGIVLPLAVVIAGCRHPRTPRTPVSATRAGHATALRFSDIAAKSGLDFRVTHTRTPLNILETAGHGCGLVDYDNDGWVDVLLLTPRRLALFHNERGHGFVEATSQAFSSHPSSVLGPQSVLMGCAVGDYDNDGWSDLFVSGYHCGALFRNMHGQFRDVSHSIPLTRALWLTSAVFFDANRDGWLDLYVGAYVKFGPEELQLCDFANVRAACPPHYYDPEVGRFYLNLGRDRSFRDGTREFGLENCHGKTLGVAAADFDRDGWCDLYLANDGMPGDLFHNERGRFVNVGIASGTAFNARGQEQAGMGVDWGDCNGDGLLDLVVTTFQFEPTSLYHNLGRRFLEAAGPAGLAAPTINTLGFGVKFLDADNDGDLDLLVANGHVQDNVNRILPSVTYAQPLQLFENRQDAGRREMTTHVDDRFVEVGRLAGEALTRPMVGRALAVGDVNNDGKVDVLVSNLEGVPRLLVNQTPTVGNWLTVRLQGRERRRGRASPVDGAGAVVIAQVRGQEMVRAAGTGGSYLSASDERIHFGLGRAPTIDRLTIHWPSGSLQVLKEVRANQCLTVSEP